MTKKRILLLVVAIHLSVGMIAVWVGCEIGLLLREVLKGLK